MRVARAGHEAPERGFRLLDFEIDLRVGGTMTVIQQGPDAMPYRITYVGPDPRSRRLRGRSSAGTSPRPDGREY